MTNPVVSVITPVYNAMPYLTETVESVLRQTFEDWELLLIDDGSTDDSLEAALAFSRADTRIRVLQMESNGGPARARNRGIDESHGGWVAFLDADDLWLFEKLEKQIDYARRGNHKFTFTGYRRINGAGSRVGHLILGPARLDRSSLLKNTAIYTSTVLLERQIIGDLRFTPGLKCDDYTLYLDVLRTYPCAILVAEDLVRYRILGSSHSRQKASYAQDVWKMYSEWSGLGRVKGALYFASYALNASIKRFRF